MNQQDTKTLVGQIVWKGDLGCIVRFLLGINWGDEDEVENLKLINLQL